MGAARENVIGIRKSSSGRTAHYLPACRCSTRGLGSRFTITYHTRGAYKRISAAKSPPTEARCMKRLFLDEMVCREELI